MTTRSPDDPGSGQPRRTRPKPDRTGPRRSIVNAFYQPDDAGPAKMNGRRFEDDHVWGAGGDTDADPGAQEAIAAKSRSGALWSDPFEAVRAAYGVVNEQIRAGYEEAARIGGDGDGPRGRKLTQILNRLVQTYTDLGTQWIDLVLATAENRERQPGSSAGAPAMSDEMSLAVELTTGRPARARALLYRPVIGALRAWPLQREGGAGEITAVGIAPGPVLKIEVSADTEPGLYRGIVIEDGVEEPAGSIILTILDEADG